MVHRHRPGLSFVRDAVIATAVVVGLYWLARGVRLRLLQIPGYLLLLGFDLLERIFGPAGADYDLLFTAYLVGLGLAGAVVAYALRKRAHGTDLPGWRFGVAGALSAVGTVSLLLALAVFLGSFQLVPGLITGATGLVLLALAGWLAGLFDALAHS